MSVMLFLLSTAVIKVQEQSVTIVSTAIPANIIHYLVYLFFHGKRLLACLLAIHVTVSLL